MNHNATRRVAATRGQLRHQLWIRRFKAALIPIPVAQLVIFCDIELAFMESDAVRLIQAFENFTTRSALPVCFGSGSATTSPLGVSVTTSVPAAENASILGESTFANSET